MAFRKKEAWQKKDKRGEILAEVRRSERSTGRESVQWMKHDDKSFSGSKSACACVFTDHVETETAGLVSFRVYVCAHAGGAYTRVCM